MIPLITVNMLSNQHQLSHSIFVISMELRMSCHTVVNVTGHTTQHGVKVTPIRGHGDCCVCHKHRKQISTHVH